jgi:hypothetical protein
MSSNRFHYQGTAWASAAMLCLMLAAAACSDHTAPTAARDFSPAANQAHANRTVGTRGMTPVSPEWQAQARSLVGANNLNSFAGARVYAALSVAQYSAVVRSDGHHDHDDDLVRASASRGHGFGAGGRSSVERQRGAVAGASAQILEFFFPAAAATLEQLVEADANVDGKIHPEFSRGLVIGRAAGDAIATRTANDHFNDPFTGTIPAGPGIWIPKGPPVGPTIGGTTPYFLTSGDEFRPGPPPAFGSPEFLTALGDIRRISDTRTADQVAIALKWNFGSGTFTAGGYWNQAAAGYIQSNGLDERAATHVFALMHAAMMDAVIGCFDAKYHYWFIRPPQADPLIKTAEPSVLPVITLLCVGVGRDRTRASFPRARGRGHGMDDRGGIVSHVRRHSLSIRH